MAKRDTKNLRRRGQKWFVRVQTEGRDELIPAGRSHREALAAREYLLAKAADATRDDAFAKVAGDYIQKGMSRLKATTQQDRRAQVEHFRRRFGDRPLRSLERRDLIQWWRDEIEGTTRRWKTGRNYVDSLSAVFAHAEELASDRDPIPNPIPTFRTWLKQQSRNAAGRAEASVHCNPITDVQALGRLAGLAQQRAERGGQGSAHGLALLLMLDTGMRIGEAIAVRWQDIEFGTDENDRSRCIHIERSYSRESREATTPKSGRARKVQLSRRLRRALVSARKRWVAAGQPRLEVAYCDKAHFRRHVWPKMLREASLPLDHFLKDLRDTYASQLLTCGVSVKYVGGQLGHSSSQVTEKHYARYLPGDDGDDYRDPMQRLPGEVPADFLARMGSESGQLEGQSELG